MKTVFNRIFWLAALLLGLWCVRQSVVFVDETEWVVVTNFGQIVAVYDQAAGPSNDRGLHFKLPWHGVRRFDRRLQVFAPAAREMVTNSRHVSSVSVVGGNLTVACYVCWKIPASAAGGSFDERPVVRFLRSVRSGEGAELRLDKLVRSQLGSEIANVQLSDLLHVPTDAAPNAGPSMIRTIGDRVAQSLAPLRQEAGIEVVDVQIRRINLPEGNRRAEYARQMSERQRIADKYRSEGKAEAKRIISQANRESEAILAQAYAEAQRLRGEGEAAATKTYAEAYGRDPEFFQLLRSLQAYEEMLGDQTTMILSSDSPMLKLLRNGLPANAAPAPIPGPQPAPAVGLKEEQP